jgi:hypothetical protein
MDLPSISGIHIATHTQAALTPVTSSRLWRSRRHNSVTPPHTDNVTGSFRMTPPFIHYGHTGQHLFIHRSALVHSPVSTCSFTGQHLFIHPLASSFLILEINGREPILSKICIAQKYTNVMLCYTTKLVISTKYVAKREISHGRKN